jgi:hypothetical protein
MVAELALRIHILVVRVQILTLGHDWSVSAGPTMEAPGVIATGPWMKAERVPSRYNSPLAAALPMCCSDAMSDGSGR